MDPMFDEKISEQILSILCNGQKYSIDDIDSKLNLPNIDFSLLGKYLAYLENELYITRTKFNRKSCFQLVEARSDRVGKVLTEDGQNFNVKNENRKTISVLKENLANAIYGDTVLLDKYYTQTIVIGKKIQERLNLNGEVVRISNKVIVEPCDLRYSILVTLLNAPEDLKVHDQILFGLDRTNNTDEYNGYFRKMINDDELGPLSRTR